MTVDTKKVARRSVRYASPADALADARALAAAEATGRLVARGNWTLGQALNHLAAWIDFAYAGPPPGAAPPWYIRALAPLLKKTILARGLRPGLRFPGVPGGTHATDIVPTVAALDHFAVALARLEYEPPAKPNAFFGPLTRAEWIALQLRHAELHLSFFDEPRA